MTNRYSLKKNTIFTRSIQTMIPKQVINLLDKPLAGHIGSRDNKLNTTEAMIWGVRMNPEKGEVTIFVPESVASQTINNVTSNKQVSCFISHPNTHESYQLKGEYITHEVANEEDAKLQDDFVFRFYDGYMKHFNYPPSIVNAVNNHPGIGITFKVKDVFVQTPGPNAGTKIN